MKTYDLIIQGVTALAMDEGNTTIDDCVIGIEQGAITLLEKAQPDAQYQAREHIDARGMLALPGFVDTHTHCFQSRKWHLGSRPVAHMRLY